MSLGEQITAVLVAIFGAGGVGGVWLQRRSAKKPPLPREEADAAEAAASLNGATAVVTQALTERIIAVSREFEQKLLAEKTERKLEVGALREELEDVKEWRARVKKWWANDIVPNWHIHRKQEYPPDMPF